MDPKNLLIFRIGHLGDTVVALPAIWGVREAFPNARLTLLTNFDARNPHYVSPRSVLPEHGLIDDWIAYPSNTGGVASAMAFLWLPIKLRRGRYDSVIYLSPRTRTTQQIDRDVKFFRAAGIDRVIGTEYLRNNRLSLEIPKPTPEVMPEAEFLLQCLSSEGISVSRSNTDLLLSHTEITAAKEWLSRTAFSGGRSVAVAPGSKWPAKIWPEERYAEVVRRLIEEKDCFPIVVGGPEDRSTGERLLSAWHGGANAAGALTIRQSAALLAECDLYLGNDTGNMHLAGAVGTPCVAIFADLDWKGRFVPFGDKNTILRRSIECEGCLTADCFSKHRCIDAITVDEVYQACVKTLEEEQ